MVDKLMLLEVLNCWYLELKNPDLPDSRSWRDYLTPYQKNLSRSGKNNLMPG